MPDSPVPRQRLRLLGHPQLVRHGAGPQALPRERRTQLVAWLALRRTWVGRPELAALLWPEQESRLAYTNLRKAVHRLQDVPWAAAGLQAQGQALRFDADTDVADFEAALAAGRVDEALALYTDRLLAGFDDDANAAWSERLTFERERLHAAWRAAALARLGDDDLAAGSAVALAARLVAADPLDEAAVAQQMRALARSGQTAAASAAYRAYAERVAGELGVEPAAALKAQHEALGRAATATATAATAATAATTATTTTAATATAATAAAASLPSASSSSPASSPAPAPPADADAHAEANADAHAAALTRGGGTPAARAPGTPAADDGFVGRASELQRIAALLAEDDCAVLCLVGPGGVGKTRLARRAMHVLAGGFADGAVFVPLEDVSSAAEVGAHLADMLGVAAEGRRVPSAPASRQPLAAAPAASTAASPAASSAASSAASTAASDAAFDDVRRHLAARQMLLVLDNFEHLAGDAAWLDELARACPRLKVIVTSRVRPLSRAAWTLPVDGLPCPEAEDADRLEAFDAARLFVRAAQRVEPALQPAASAAAIVDICRQVEGLPLALELAAGFTRVLSCEAIAAELRAGTELLRTADPTRSPRQASIEAVFEHSWRHLAPAERQALARLAIFRGGFTPGAARSVAGVSLPVLAALADKSLVRKAAADEPARRPAADDDHDHGRSAGRAGGGAGGGADGGADGSAFGHGGDTTRCHLHPLVQQFALQRLGDDAAAVAAAHSRHFLHWLAAAAEPLGLARRPALREADHEFANLRAAWHWAAASAAGGQDLARAAPALMSYCDHRGRGDEGLQLLREALAGAAIRGRAGQDTDVDIGHARLAAPLAAAAAHLEYRLDHYGRAEAQAAQALALAQRGGDAAAELQCTKVLAAAGLRTGRPAEARRWYERTLALAQDLGDARNTAGTLDNLSLVERHLGHIDAALDLSRRALLQHRALADAAGEALCLSNQCLLHTARGDLASAREALLAARRLCEAHGLPAIRGLVECNLADIADKEGDHAAMERHARAALEISRGCGQRAITVAAHQSLTLAALRRGEPAQARRELAAALELALVIGRPGFLVNGSFLFACVLAAQGDRDCAAQVMAFALGHPGIVGRDREEAEAHLREWRGPAGRSAPWPGFDLDALARRIVLEAGRAFAPLLAELRSAA